MEKIQWVAGNGTGVSVENVVEEELVADHTLTRKIDEIEIKLGSKTLIYQGIINLDGGKAMQCLGVTVRIPAEKADAVITIITDCKNRRDAKSSKRAAQEKEYNKNYSIVERAMAE